ncbi:hypothetical protein [uncultured Fibrobacter sp.]|uniref:hypothetical protein n=1 Tax=uncultured Fibrobacter sp. TaxID=261512 RepID=UPI00280603E1|nr:hypothetical protein [uncultured Fibrobacter sp.]
MNNRKICSDNFWMRGYGCNSKYIAWTLKNCLNWGRGNVRLGAIRAIYEQATAKVF